MEREQKKQLFQKRKVVVLGAMISTILWGSAFPCIKVGYQIFEVGAGDSASQILFAGIRFFLAGILTVLFGSLISRRWLVPAKASLPKIGALALAQTIGQYICNKGGKVYKKKLIKTVRKNKTKVKMKNLKKGRYYKYIVRAYKIINGKIVTIAASCTIHATTTGGKLGVAKAIKIKKVGKKKSTKITLKKGKTAKIKAVEVRQIKSKRIPVYRAISYEVSNSKVAKVTKSGKIKAKKKGTCKIWVYAQNGVYKTITLTVK